MQTSEHDWKDKLTAHILKNGDDIDFTRYFWKGCEPLERDVIGYHRFVRVVQSVNLGNEPDQVASSLNANTATIRHRSFLAKMPKLGHYLKAFIQLGIPQDGLVWLNTDCSHGYALPIGQFVQVPTNISKWEDVEAVLVQIVPLKSPTTFSRKYLFGFLFGMIIGDGSKSKQKTAHRHIGLVLSKKYQTNVALGDFTCVCAQSVGLRMHRTADLYKPRGKPHGFFEWVSKSSQLIDWLYHVGLG